MTKVQHSAQDMGDIYDLQNHHPLLLEAFRETGDSLTQRTRKKECQGLCCLRRYPDTPTEANYDKREDFITYME